MILHVLTSLFKLDNWQEVYHNLDYDVPMTTLQLQTRMVLCMTNMTLAMFWGHQKPGHG